MKEKIAQIYLLTVELYYEVADDDMKRRGHPGVMGTSSNDSWDSNICVLDGAVETLKQISAKLKNNLI